jgi:hypothetical protein
MPLWNPYGYEYYGEFNSFHQINDYYMYAVRRVSINYRTIYGTGSIRVLEPGLSHYRITVSVYWLAVGYGGIESRILDELILHPTEYSLNASSVRIFPNPASDIINISSGSIISQVAIYDHLGNLVQQLLPHNRNFTIQVNGLQPGLYLIEAVTHDEVSCQKVIVVPH